MLKKLDIKTIFIIILGAALILMFIFKGGKIIGNNDEEIKLLKANNISLKLKKKIMKFSLKRYKKKIYILNKKGIRCN